MMTFDQLLTTLTFNVSILKCFDYIENYLIYVSDPIINLNDDLNFRIWESIGFQNIDQNIECSGGHWIENSKQ